MHPFSSRLLACAVIIACSACVTPRSMTVGQMAAPVGRGATEVGVFGGVGYASQTNPTQTQTVDMSTVSNQTQGHALSIPAAEANIQRGFSDNFGLNVHLSSAGVQPGLKWTVNKSRVAHFALLPAIGMGFASYNETTYTAGQDGVQQETNPNSVTSFTFLVGFKAIVSHKSGVYGAVGYDFVFNRSLRSSPNSAATDRVEITTQTLSQQIMGAVGLDVALGFVHLRPEIAFAVFPAVSQTVSSKVGVSQTDLSAGGGFGWAILPGFSLAVASPPKARDENDVEDEKAAKKQRRDEGDDDDDDEPKVKKKPARDEDEDDDKPKRRRRVGDDESTDE